jgi:Zn-dependent protease with chaperone function/uncharacterized tellurite resistance protein B-like protein
VFLTAAVYLAVLILFTATTHHHNHFLENSSAFEFWHPKLFAGVALCTLAVIGIGSISKTLELNQGGSVVATSLGGRMVNPTTADPDERKLLNVVEEMAIASGVPVPQVYLLPGEQGINAFAAGHTTSDAVIAVTSGAMKLLSRDELQGVIAHEFSHVLNGDMRLNIRLMGAIFGILCLAIIGRILLQVRGRSSRDRNALPILGLALLAIGSIGVLFGRLIQAAVSRQREFLADASAVQFTRNPSGLAGALKKIGGLSFGSRLQTSHADAASHMFFSNGMRSSFFHLMDTHPPLSQRILAIDPGFDGVFPNTDALAKETFISKPTATATRAPASFPIPGLPPILGRPLAGFVSQSVVTSAAIVNQAGTPTTAHLRYAGELRNEIPVSVQNAARESLGATALVYALLLSDDPAAQTKQLGELAATTSSGICQETLRLLPEVRMVSSRAKLPLVDLALPGLRHMSRLQFQEFSKAIKALVESDGEIDLFEYMLQKIVMRHLEPQYAGARKPVVQYYSLKPLLGDCAVLLSELAYVGQQGPGEVARAFERGAQVLSAAAQSQIELTPETECDLEHVDEALNRLNLAVPQIKKNLLEACAQTVAADGVIQEMEAELLRAVADALDCPMPPLITSSIAQPV